MALFYHIQNEHNIIENQFWPPLNMNNEHTPLFISTRLFSVTFADKNKNNFDNFRFPNETGLDYYEIYEFVHFQLNFRKWNCISFFFSYAVNHNGEIKRVLIIMTFFFLTFCRNQNNKRVFFLLLFLIQQSKCFVFTCCLLWIQQKKKQQHRFTFET